MSLARWRCREWSFVVLSAGCALLGACGANPPGGSISGDLTIAAESLSGEVAAVNFRVPLGQTSHVTGDLVIRASGDVDIAGDLVADDSVGEGYGITIIADGEITVTGRIQTGDGASGLSATLRAQDGGGGVDGCHAGPLVMHAADLYIAKGTQVISGRGGDGANGTFGGAGGNGGTITLRGGATLTMLGNLTVGDGGIGGEAFTTASNLPPDGRFGNGGGFGGALAVSAEDIDWPHLDTTDPTLYQLNLAAYNSDPQTGYAIASFGGWAGGVLISDDAIAASSTSRARGIAPTDPPTDCPAGSQCVSAAAGGWGLAHGGTGGDVGVISFLRYAEDGDAQSWMAQAGDGGGVDESLDLATDPPPGPRFIEVIIVEAQAGDGGTASILCGPGKMGTADGPNGADGGSGIAVGGSGGKGMDVALQRGGAGGFASVIAGEGGEGLEHGCTPGNGGKGGSAEAYGGNGGEGGGTPPAPGGDATAIAGPGGNGGNGGSLAGLAGAGGRQFTRTGMDGTTGVPGSVSIGGIEVESKADDGQPGDTDILHCGG